MPTPSAPALPPGPLSPSGPAADSAPGAPAVPLARLLDAHRGPLGRLVTTYAPRPADAEDLRQEIALALFRAWPSFRGEASERTFVLRVAHHRAVSALSSRRRQPTAAADADVDVHDVAATTGTSPALVLERAQRTHALLAAVRALPLARRQVLTLALEGLDHGEIGAVLGISPATVAVRLHRARAALRVLLEDGPSSAPMPEPAARTMPETKENGR